MIVRLVSGRLGAFVRGIATNLPDLAPHTLGRFLDVRDDLFRIHGSLARVATNVFHVLSIGHASVIVMPNSMTVV